ncbi:MAG: toll/interleukin-1 receptor domain-containing protein, partial [Clostridia bacterium]|nr:toll/interleukin-1 receptor domain-containing protein [Clostridia bacterium]
MVFQCKMCGAALNYIQGNHILKCEYCKTMQTVPRLDGDKRAHMYERANHYRRNNEYDKAMGIFESILNEDNTDAEAYWSLVLCRYGVDYVKDPYTSKYIPTINRTQYKSIFSDEDYKSAISYADEAQIEIYKSEAAAIDKLQSDILTVAKNEAPFDIFICYKETDKNGNRTVDSIYAQDIYNALTKEGYKVFFSRITLEDKLGQAYEPYIFSALNTAKVMVVAGTSHENFNAPWVKNEWSRYLALIKNGEDKFIIPAFKDMNPYDLPQEFSNLQAQDMAKIGFLQDLVRGIGKLIKPIGNNKENTSIVYPINTEALCKRIEIFLADGNFSKADEYTEKALDLEPENAKLYIYKLLISLKIKNTENLISYPKAFYKNTYYIKAVNFAKGDYL